MASLDPIYRLSIFEDFTKTTLLSPVAGAVHSDEFKLTTREFGDAE